MSYSSLSFVGQKLIVKMLGYQPISLLLFTCTLNTVWLRTGTRTRCTPPSARVRFLCMSRRLYWVFALRRVSQETGTETRTASIPTEIGDYPAPLWCSSRVCVLE